MVLTKISKSNRSVVIIVPKKFADALQLKAKEYMSVSLEDNNKLCFQKVTVTPSRVFIKDKEVTDEVAEPFYEIKKSKKIEEIKKPWI